jgi:hypothetical protein
MYLWDFTTGQGAGVAMYVRRMPESSMAQLVVHVGAEGGTHESSEVVVHAPLLRQFVW